MAERLRSDMHTRVTVYTASTDYIHEGGDGLTTDIVGFYIAYAGTLVIMHGDLNVCAYQAGSWLKVRRDWMPGKAESL